MRERLADAGGEPVVLVDAFLAALADEARFKKVQPGSFRAKAKNASG